MDRTVIALFASFAGAAHGIELLQRAGFSADQIGIVAQSDVVRDHLGEDQDRRVLESVGAGVVGGSLFGGLPDRTRSIVENQYRQIQDAHRHTVELEQKSKSQEG